MVAVGDEFSNPRSGERFVWRATAASTAGAFCEFDLFLKGGATVAAPHVHPRQTETFDVVSGDLSLEIAHERRRLRAGERGVVPPGTRHAWGVAGTEPAEVLVRLEPALNIEEFFERFCAIARNGGATRSGVPRNPFRLALFLHDFRAEWAFPEPWQRRLLPPVMALLAALARRFGVSPTGDDRRRTTAAVEPELDERRRLP